jgi:hypothetical protein
LIIVGLFFGAKENASLRLCDLIADGPQIDLIALRLQPQLL